MNNPKDWRIQIKLFSIAMGIAFSLALWPLATQAQHSSTSACNALVSIGDDLYLADPAGKALARFPSGWENGQYVTVSPDGSRVAYASLADTRAGSTFTVVSADGNQNSFPLYPASIDMSSFNNVGEQGVLEDMRWSADDVLRMAKHASPTATFFTFHHINKDLTSPAPVLATNFGNDCVLRRGSGGGVACVFGGDVSLGSGLNNGIFYQSPFEGIAPIASFKLTKGESITTAGDPVFTIQVLSVSEDGVGIKITYANGLWEEDGLSKGSFADIPGVNNDHAFSATVLDAGTGLVRVDELKVPTGSKTTLDPALAWQPHGTGLLIIRRQNNQAVLCLIQPRGERRQRGKHQQWQLVATAPIDIGRVQAMRFASPTSLLLQTRTYGSIPQFSAVPIHISNGSKGGKPTITLGTVTSLPASASVTVKGVSSEGSVLDWSCGGHGRH